MPMVKLQQHTVKPLSVQKQEHMPPTRAVQRFCIMLRAIWPDVVPASLIDFGFHVWGTGFLGLVCFGFYARIRDIRA